MRSVEDGTLRRDPVEVRRRDFPAPVGADRLVAVVVGNDEDEIGIGTARAPVDFFNGPLGCQSVSIEEMKVLRIGHKADLAAE
jgi:hypothetical protein